MTFLLLPSPLQLEVGIGMHSPSQETKHALGWGRDRPARGHLGFASTALYLLLTKRLTGSAHSLAQVQPPNEASLARSVDPSVSCDGPACEGGCCRAQFATLQHWQQSFYRGALPCSIGRWLLLTTFAWCVLGADDHARDFRDARHGATNRR